MILFDKHGNLPANPVFEITLDEFEAVFVLELEEKSHRKQLFENYLRFLEVLKSGFDTPFYQLVDGSFTTQKPFPNDIDVVTFLPIETIVEKAALVRELSERSKIRFQVDAHFSPVCRWNHRFFEKSKTAEADWLDLFGHTRGDENHPRLPKGIIKIQF